MMIAAIFINQFKDFQGTLHGVLQFLFHLEKRKTIFEKSKRAGPCDKLTTSVCVKTLLANSPFFFFFSFFFSINL